MLSGYLPFGGKEEEEIFLNIKTGKLNFDSPEWQKVTPPAIDLVKKLLDPDENARLTASQAQKHPWFASVKKLTPEVDELDRNVMSLLKK